LDSGKPIDIDAMMKDIDKRLAELDEEEKREKEKIKAKNHELLNMFDDDLEKNSNKDVKPLTDIITGEKTTDEKANNINNDSTSNISNNKINEDEDILFLDEDEVLDSPLSAYQVMDKIDDKRLNSFNQKQVVNKVEPVKENNKIVKEDTLKNESVNKLSLDEEPELFDISDNISDIKANENNEKPKINVDADSIIVNDNLITDDEFFDDFFSE